MPEIIIDSFTKETVKKVPCFDKSNLHQIISGSFPFVQDIALEGNDKISPVIPNYKSPFRISNLPSSHTMYNYTDGSFKQTVESIPQFLLQYQREGKYDVIVLCNDNRARVILSSSPDSTTSTVTPEAIVGMTPSGACLFSGKMFVMSNSYNKQIVYTDLPLTNSSQWKVCTGLQIEGTDGPMKGFRDIVAVAGPISRFDNPNAVYYITANGEVKLGFNPKIKSGFYHFDIYATSYLLAFAGGNSGEGTLAYLWDGVNTTYTQCIPLPYERIYGTVRRGTKFYAFAKVKDGLACLEFNGVGFTEVARTRIDISKPEIFDNLNQFKASVAVRGDYFIMCFSGTGQVIHWNVSTNDCVTTLAGNILPGYSVHSSLVIENGESIFIGCSDTLNSDVNTGKVFMFSPEKNLIKYPEFGLRLPAGKTEQLWSRYTSNEIIAPKSEAGFMRGILIKRIRFEVDGSFPDSDRLSVRISTKYNQLESSKEATVEMTRKNNSNDNLSNNGLREMISGRLGLNADSFNIEIDYYRSSEINVWNGSINNIIIEYDYIQTAQ